MDARKLRLMNRIPDEGLASCSGIEAEFTTFYRAEHEPQVRRAALMLGDADAAHDVVHEALASMYRRWTTIDDPGPYLNRAVLNQCRDEARRQTKQHRLVRRLPPGEATTTSEHVIFDVLARLPFNQRAAVVMRFYAGMTEHDIAAALGARPGSVGPWIHHALAKLRKELE